MYFENFSVLFISNNYFVTLLGDLNFSVIINGPSIELLYSGGVKA